jgi:hypothetical protein
MRIFIAIRSLGFFGIAVSPLFNNCRRITTEPHDATKTQGTQWPP